MYESVHVAPEFANDIIAKEKPRSGWPVERGVLHILIAVEEGQRAHSHQRLT